MKITVLGCGPAGLMAAHAAKEAHTDASHDISPKQRYFQLQILSKPRKSDLFGAQYLHAPIPWVTPPLSRTIQYQLRGSVEGYRNKVYGDLWDGDVSPEDYIGEHDGWDLRATYDRLWSMYSRFVKPTNIIPSILAWHLKTDKPDLVINTIPLDTLCTGGHSFGYAEVVAAGDAPSRGIDIGSNFRCPLDTVVCNGEPSPSWYRISNIFGHTTVEWPAGLKPPVPTAAVVRKPTYHDCNCWPELLKVGRYGSWRKGVLTHDAYLRVYEVVSGKLSGEDEDDTAEITAQEA